MKTPTCKICGCTDNNCTQCIEAQGKPCYWITQDLCSRCFTFDIVVKYGANYLVANPDHYKPIKETLYFGQTKITPGIKIRKIGIKKRTSFEVNEDSFLKYEGTLKIRDVKHIIFSSNWKDEPNAPLFRYAFAIANTTKPKFMYLTSKSMQSGADIDCKHVELIK